MGGTQSNTQCSRINEGSTQNVTDQNNTQEQGSLSNQSNVGNNSNSNSSNNTTVTENGHYEVKSNANNVDYEYKHCKIKTDM